MKGENNACQIEYSNHEGTTMLSANFQLKESVESEIQWLWKRAELVPVNTDYQLQFSDALHRAVPYGDGSCNPLQGRKRSLRFSL